MPRFYFDAYDGEVFAKDEAGSDLRDAEAARVQAQATLAEMARTGVLRGPGRRPMFIRVLDEAGAVQLTAMLLVSYDVEG
ncbi:MAG TPA: hypothetical protein VHL98_13030 [Microvirga sp.]|jgi:hypothetical protein|nr:hypothetical protein [Microvirga sp.]